MNKDFVLGSGWIHIEEFTNETLPANFDAFYASRDNLLGLVSGGATLSYSTEKYESEDDLGYIKIDDITKENVTLKTGVINNYSKELFTHVCDTARSIDNEDGSTTIKLGGLGNQSNKIWVIGFEYKHRNLRVTLVGRNTKGFDMAFIKDKESIVDLEITARSQDNDGTLVRVDDLRKCPTLSSLEIGSLVLTPAFSPFVKSYTAATTNAKDTITATAKDNTDTVVIKNGVTTVVSGAEATWTTGENTVTITDTDTAGKVYTYTVTVTKSAG